VQAHTLREVGILETQCC